jgi:hypothetical protein
MLDGVGLVAVERVRINSEPWTENTFHLVIASTVLTSILDQRARVLAPAARCCGTTLPLTHGIRRFARSIEER